MLIRSLPILAILVTASLPSPGRAETPRFTNVDASHARFALAELIRRYRNLDAYAHNANLVLETGTPDDPVLLMKEDLEFRKDGHILLTCADRELRCDGADCWAIDHHDRSYTTMPAPSMLDLRLLETQLPAGLRFPHPILSILLESVARTRPAHPYVHRVAGVRAEDLDGESGERIYGFLREPLSSQSELPFTIWISGRTRLAGEITVDFGMDRLKIVPWIPEQLHSIGLSARQAILRLSIRHEQPATDASAARFAAPSSEFKLAETLWSMPAHTAPSVTAMHQAASAQSGERRPSRPAALPQYGEDQLAATPFASMGSHPTSSWTYQFLDIDADGLEECFYLDRSENIITCRLDGTFLRRTRLSDLWRDTDVTEFLPVLVKGALHFLVVSTNWEKYKPNRESYGIKLFTKEGSLVWKHEMEMEGNLLTYFYLGAGDLDGDTEEEFVIAIDTYRTDEDDSEFSRLPSTEALRSAMENASGGGLGNVAVLVEYFTQIQNDAMNDEDSGRAYLIVVDAKGQLLVQKRIDHSVDYLRIDRSQPKHAIVIFGTDHIERFNYVPDAPNATLSGLPTNAGNKEVIDVP